MTNWASEDHNRVPESTKVALTHSQVYLHLLLESLTDREIILLDPTGYVVGSSSGIESQKGYRAKEVIGQHFSCFFPQQDVQLGKPEQVLEIASVQGRFEEDSWYVRKDGSQFWANVAITRVRDRSGQMCGFLQITREIGTAKHLEESHRQLEAPTEERLVQLQRVNQQLQYEVAQWQQAEAVLQETRLELELRLEEQTRELKDAIAQLQSEVAERKLASVGLQQAKAELETKVEERTAQLRRVIAQLKHENAERQQVEEALRQEQEFTNVVIENVAEGIVACDADGNLRLFNRAAREWHGGDPRAVPPSEWASLYDLYRSDGVTPLPTEEIPLLRAFTGKSVRQAGMAIVAKGQPPRYILANGDPLFDNAGRKIGAVAIMHDITSRKQAEQEQARLVAILEATTDFVGTADLNGRTLYINRIGRQLLGLGADEDISNRVITQNHPHWTNEIILKQGLPVAARTGVWTGETALKAADGREIPLSQVVLAHKSTTGEVEYFSTIARDISDRKLAEAARRQSETELREKAQQLEQALRELRQTQAQAVQSEKMSSLGQLVAGIAHEINNPVNFIYGNLAYAKEYTQDLLRLLQLYQQHYPNPVPEIYAQAAAIDLDFLVEDLPKLLSSMKIGADRILKIVAALRNFSHMNEAEMKAVNIHEGIDSTLMILQHRLKAKSDHPAIEVLKNYGDLPQVECYAGQLNQVFMNILSNALDALEQQEQQQTLQQIPHSPSQIRICTERFGANWVRIRIADNGPGMSPAVQQRLFDPFFTTKAVGKGTGLGMSISYQIVTEKHGGSLQCISAPGQGAEFVIEIPVRQPSHQK